MKSIRWVSIVALGAVSIFLSFVGDRYAPLAPARVAAPEASPGAPRPSAGDLRRWLTRRRLLIGTASEARSVAARGRLDAQLREVEAELIARFGASFAGEVLAQCRRAGKARQPAQYVAASP